MVLFARGVVSILICLVPLHQVYADMGSHQVLTNGAIVVAFLAACTAAAPLDPEQLSEVFRLVAAFRASHKPRPQLYTALLTLSSRSGMQDRARGIWHAIQQARCVGVPFWWTEPAGTTITPLFGLAPHASALTLL